MKLNQHQPSNEQIYEDAKLSQYDTIAVTTELNKQSNGTNDISGQCSIISTETPAAIQELNKPETVPKETLSNMSMSYNPTVVSTALYNNGQVATDVAHGMAQENADNTNVSTIRTTKEIEPSSVHSANPVITLKKLETSNEIEHFVEWMAMEERHAVRLAMLNCLQHSKNDRILQSFVQTPKACQTLYAWLDFALTEWDPVLVKKMIEVCDTELDAEIEHLMNEWRQLLPKSDKQELRQVTSRCNWMNIHFKPRFSEKESITDADSKPITWADPNAEKKMIRLALQKDPPAKPKAITNTAFFSSLTAPQKIRVAPPPTKSPAAPTANVVAAILNQWKKPQEQVSTTTSLSKPARSKSKKRVQFAPDYCLVEVREYEKVPEEWNIDTGSINTQPSVATRDMDPRQCHWNLRPQITWYTPRQILLPSEVTLHTHVETEETKIQAARERTALAKIYTNIQHIPYSPAEPDELPISNDDCRVIPLEDTAVMEVDDVYPSYQIAPETPQHFPQTPTLQVQTEKSPLPFFSEEWVDLFCKLEAKYLLSDSLIQSLQKFGMLPTKDTVDKPLNIISNHPVQQPDQVVINEDASAWNMATAKKKAALRGARGANRAARAGARGASRGTARAASRGAIRGAGRARNWRGRGAEDQGGGPVRNRGRFVCVAEIFHAAKMCRLISTGCVTLEKNQASSLFNNMRFKVSTCEPLIKHKCWFAVDDDELDKKNPTPLTIHVLAKRIVTELSLTKKASDVIIELDGFELRPTAIVRGLLREGDSIIVRKTKTEEAPLSKKRKASDIIAEKQEGEKRKKSKKEKEASKLEKLNEKHQKNGIESKKKDRSKKKVEKKKDLLKKNTRKEKIKAISKDEVSIKKKKTSEMIKDEKKTDTGRKRNTHGESDKQVTKLPSAKAKALKQLSDTLRDGEQARKPSPSEKLDISEKPGKKATPPYEGTKRTQRRNARKRALKSLHRNAIKDKQADELVQLEAEGHSAEHVEPDQNVWNQPVEVSQQEDEAPVAYESIEVIEPQNFVVQNRNKKKTFLKEMNKARKHVRFSMDDEHEDQPTLDYEQKEELHAQDHGSAFVTSMDAAYGVPVDHNATPHRKYPIHNARIIRAGPRYDETIQSGTDTMEVDAVEAETETEDVASNEPVIPAAPKDYEAYANIDFTTPDVEAGDHLAIKIFQLSAMYTPEISDWKEVKLVDIKREQRSLVVEYLPGFSADVNKGGKFDLIPKGDEDEVENEGEEERVFTYGEGDIIQMKKLK
ncbi:hypothetical protein EC973_006222 [Apophysomyces ossiformis]|uniref:Coilin n=1 Tax=Apophysomyces ossiformis TaxID=679940 RepID=A0A8H7BJT6_9FUNG|nr:hypothetical protein EC973_006222 [Apophysomyces ossiformis]